MFLRCDEPGLAAAWHTQPGPDLLAALRSARDAWGGGLMNAFTRLVQATPLARYFGIHR